MQPTCWKVDTTAVSLMEILTWGVSQAKADRLLVSTREGRGHSPNSVLVKRSIKRLFEPYVIDEFLASSWPGTELIGHYGRVFIIELNPAVKDAILSTEPDLTKWLNNHTPPLPEDLSLFSSANSYPCFISVTHEKLAWLISETRPKLDGISNCKVNTDELFWKGKYFCKEWSRKKLKNP